ncbi:MAG: hypothetical protein ACRECD_03175, partial [Burkholderiaceae bacterium]
GGFSYPTFLIENDKRHGAIPCDWERMEINDPIVPGFCPREKMISSLRRRLLGCREAPRPVVSIATPA